MTGPDAARIRSSESIMRDIVKGLYEGRFVPGQRLVEADLTAHYNVSRGPVREALNRLAATGVVELGLRRMARIRLLDREEAINLLTLLEVLVGFAARLAAEKIHSEGASERLESALEALAGLSSKRALESARARDGFYAALIGIGGNAELMRLIPTVLVHLLRVQLRREMATVDSFRQSDYRAIAAAVRAGAPERAERAARRHIRRALDVVRTPPETISRDLAVEPASEGPGER